jgi:hypothetical protein
MQLAQLRDLVAAFLQGHPHLVGPGCAEGGPVRLDIPDESPASHRDLAGREPGPQALTEVPGWGHGLRRQGRDADELCAVLLYQRQHLGGQGFCRGDLERVARGVEPLPEHHEGELVGLVAGWAA